MKTHKFARKPFYVDAVRVSEENIQEVAKWCNGEVQSSAEEGLYIKVRVHRPLTERQTMAFIGDWVLFAGSGFKVYTPKAFDKSFEKVKTLTKAQADEAGIRPPIEKKAKKPVPSAPKKKPANPVLSKEQAEQLQSQKPALDSFEVEPPKVESSRTEPFQVARVKLKDDVDAFLDEAANG